MLSRSDKKFSIIALVSSLFIHLLFFLILIELPVKVKGKEKLVYMRVIEEKGKIFQEKTLINQKKRNQSVRKLSKPAVEKKQKRKSRVRKEKRVIDLRKIKKKSALPPSSYSGNRQGKAEKVKPVFGLSPKSVVGKGGENGFRVGNTLFKEPEKKVTPPEKVKSYNQPLTPLSLVTSLPRFKHVVKPVYPRDLRKLGIEGVVVLDVVVSSTGRVVSVSIVKGDYPQFISAAVAAIKKTTFYPAEVNGVPVSVKIRIPVKFRLVE